MDNKGIKVKSLYKAMTLLGLFTLENPERGVKELADLTGMLKSSVYNILSTFQVCGFIEKADGGGKYRLGKRIMELNSVLANSDTIMKTIKPFMERVAGECNEVVYFAFPTDTDVLYAEAAYPPGMHFTRLIAGVRAEMFCTAIGKAMLAFMDEAMFRRVIAKDMPAYTANTLVTPEALARELEETRRRGYAVDNMEHEHGVRCIGVPVRNNRGGVIGALSISGPSLRIMDEKIPCFAAALIRAVEEVRDKLA